jgi:DNA-directed RNA polymerase subunit M/transcription elongation factor TFIIS
MSFKDKPLKKIVADTRVTIDALHNDIIDEFTNNKKVLEESKQELEKIVEEGEGDEKVKELKKNIEKCENKKRDEVNYYLNTSDLLNEYYSKKDGHAGEKNVEMSVIDFMNKKNKKKDTDDLINKYMVEIDDTIIPEKTIQNIDMCRICNSVLTLKTTDSVLFCEKCGYTESIIINSEKVSYKDPPRESSYFAYKRINHFNEWLAQFQAKETTDIPQEVYDGILAELKKDRFIDMNNLSYKTIRTILKKLKFNKFYEHIPHIINILNGERAPVLTRQYEEQLRMMFKEIQTPFMEHCPPDRKNFLSYAYVLHKFCELLELDDLLIYFPLLKSREKLQQQDKIWEKICRSLQWQYIPSI